MNTDSLDVGNIWYTTQFKSNTIITELKQQGVKPDKTFIECDWKQCSEPSHGFTRWQFDRCVKAKSSSKREENSTFAFGMP